eukprot:9504051-Pyramimonas_sp.AAC.1
MLQQRWAIGKLSTSVDRNGSSCTQCPNAALNVKRRVRGSNERFEVEASTPKCRTRHGRASFGTAQPRPAVHHQLTITDVVSSTHPPSHN